MTRNAYAHEIRKNLTRTTAREPQSNARHKRCTAYPCENPTQAFAGKGLSQTYCTSHVRHVARHGTAHRGSYRAAELKPYLWAAQRWLKENKNDTLVKRVEFAFEAMLIGDGKAPDIATRLIRTSASFKATLHTQQPNWNLDRLSRRLPRGQRLTQRTSQLQ